MIPLDEFVALTSIVVGLSLFIYALYRDEEGVIRSKLKKSDKIKFTQSDEIKFIQYT